MEIFFALQRPKRPRKTESRSLGVFSENTKDLETVNGDDLKRSYGTDSEKSLKQQYDARLARYKGTYRPATPSVRGRPVCAWSVPIFKI